MSGNLKPYAEYRESGLRWLEGTPAHWPLQRAKWLFQRMERPIFPTDDVVTCFRDGTVTLRKNRRTAGFTEALKEFGYQGVRRGDLVIHAMDAFAGACGVSDSDGKCTPVYAVCQSAPDANPHYYAYIVREMAHRQWIAALSRGIRERSTDFRFDTFSNQWLPAPPREEQDAIVRYLAKQSHTTNRLIHAKRRLIALLTEQKQAIIHRAVTLGLDPAAPRKPSGVAWLGEVPAHWEVKRIKHLARLRSGDGITSYGIHETGQYPVFGGNGTRGFTNKYTHHGEFVLIGRQGALCGNVNYASGQFWASEHAVVAMPLQWYDHTWFGELLRTMNLNQYSVSAAQPGLAVERVQNLRIPVPPHVEQTGISEYIRAETADLNRTIGSAQREIDLIREYRTRLIADVVTGKVDVRHLAADLPPLEAEEIIPVEEVDALLDDGGPLDDPETLIEEEGDAAD